MGCVKILCFKYTSLLLMSILKEIKWEGPVRCRLCIVFMETRETSG